jgi:hypothetical protein
VVLDSECGRGVAGRGGGGGVKIKIKNNCHSARFLCAVRKSKQTTIKLYNAIALPVLLYGSGTWTVKARDARRITAAEMKYTECPGRNVKNFGRVFLMLKYTDITQNTYIQS